MSESIDWAWVRRFAEQFTACGVTTGDATVVLCERASRSALVDTSRLALQSIGAAVVVVEATTPPNRGPVPIRSTGASVAIADAASKARSADCGPSGPMTRRQLRGSVNVSARVLGEVPTTT